MEDIFVEPGMKTPLVEIKKEGKIRIEGNSMPENPRIFFYPIMKKFNQIVDEWKISDIENIEMSIKLNYFNSASAKFLFDVMSLLTSLRKNYKKNIEIKWFYEESDEDMKDMGEQVASYIDLDFIFVKFDDKCDDEE